MDDKKLHELAGVETPKPNMEAKKRAINAAVHAFEAQQAEAKKVSPKINTQGNQRPDRLTHNDNETLWSRLMTGMMKRRLIAGTALAGTFAFVMTVGVMQQQTNDAWKIPEVNESPADIADNNSSLGDAVVKAEGEKKSDANELDTDGARIVQEAEVGAKGAQSEGKVKEVVESASTPEPVAPNVVADAVVAPSSNFGGFEEGIDTGSQVKRKEFIPQPPTFPPGKQRMGSRMTAQAQVIPPALAQYLRLRSDDNDRATPPAYSGRDQFDEFNPNPLQITRDTPVSTLSVDVDTASYAFVRRALMNGHLPQKSAVRIEELINYFGYDYALPDNADVPFKPTVTIYPTPWNEGTKLMHIAVKGHDIIPAEKPRANLVFLLDVSGSMSSADKLPLLKNAFAMMVENLSENDTVAIVTYAGRAATILEPTSVKDKAKILAALSNLSSGGSTAGAQGIEQAYALAEAGFEEGGVNRVILATDGDFNVGIRDTDELKGYIERKRDSGIYLSVLGFGQGNYNDSLMQALAQNGNGNAAYIDTLNEARKVLVEEAGSTLFPIAADVKIQVEFNPEIVAEYRLIGYESRMLKREDFNNDKVDAAEIGSGHSVTAIYEITPVGSSAQQVDPLRYGSDDKPKKASKDGEYAFLKMRYKLPGSDTSKLISLPITKANETNNIGNTSDDVRFATSVAAFGQLLRGEATVGEYSYDHILTLARDARGKDEFGYRSEFLNLVRLAKSAREM